MGRQVGEQLAKCPRVLPMQLVSVLQRENLDFMNNDNHKREVKKCL